MSAAEQAAAAGVRWERNLLGCLLEEPALVSEVGELTPAHFLVPYNGKILRRSLTLTSTALLLTSVR